ncbi:MAG: cytochrome d ubiquinol oxidase subunit II [Gammaproteobacteria bacterium]|nr:cytochrome d ubiquinol oxidase subunit II [Gammaproteobacteria bacterium]
MILDYETLKLIWWLFVGVLLIGFAVTDGFDLGVGTLLPFVGRNDEERRVVINSIGPTWDGNQVWFITAGGALFAAWPLVYAAAFSGFYFALLLVLLALILRPVGFDFRSKLPSERWRRFWDWALFVGGAVPALVFGVAFGNLLQGVPFHYDASLRPFYTGSFLALLNPYALLAGLVSLCMLIMHGSLYLQMRTEDEIYRRAKKATAIFATLSMILFALAGAWLAFGVEGYKIVAMPDPNSAFSPLAKTVARAPGAWLSNYGRHPWLLLAPALGFAGAALAMLAAARNRPGIGFVCSACALAGVILTAGFAMFPFVLPSSTSPNDSLTAWDAVSSRRTLMIMFWAVLIFLPVVIAYTSWVFSKLRGKITAEQIHKDTHTAY